MAFVASVAAQEPAYGRRPTPQPAPQPADVCESPLKVHHPESKVLGKWSTYTGKPQTNRRGCRPKKNFVFMISDGFGIASETIAREFYQWQTHGSDAAAMADVDDILPLDALHVGSVRTKASDSWVTDSAASATSFASGIKTANGAIGVDQREIPVATILEAAKQHGYLTGLVATSRITHATPAGFSAHVTTRDQEDLIAVHQIGDNPLGRSVDLMLGGGRRHFQPNTTRGGTRRDGRDLIAEGRNKFGWKSFIETRQELVQLPKTKAALPLLGLFAASHMDYEIDRNATAQASLAEMTDAALTILADASSECDSPGFFLMVEGSRIDHAAHANDAPTHIYDILAYQHAVSVVKSFVRANPNTGAISTSDHETGGVGKGWQVDRNRDQKFYYAWNPDKIATQKASIESFSSTITRFNGTDVAGFIRRTVADRLGVTDLTDAELARLIQGRDDAIARRYPGVFSMDNALSTLISTRSLVGFNTNGHTGQDVELYAINAPGLRGNMDNTYVAKYAGQFLGVWDSIPALSQRLRGMNVGPSRNSQPKVKRSFSEREYHVHHEH
ncbi:alkaline-phosphatase-like protein [Catenaria anguillulae PL171]|uniref:Alkaline phosphatase n=1 Tax=Catenaria anguillulae PL171 TaxID=765915 RepID=A0A1Y2I6B7_9FUNG|nr:alkaline-phosphatase-like protein [Catenaria anguillulae PL171]